MTEAIESDPPSKSKIVDKIAAHLVTVETFAMVSLKEMFCIGLERVHAGLVLWKARELVRKSHQIEFR